MGRMIEKELEKAGYKMLGSNKNIERLITTILQTGNTRYLKAIPFLIHKHKPNIKKICMLAENKKLCSALLSITSKLFSEIHPEDSIPGYPLDETLLKRLKLSYNEFKDEFILQLRNEENPNLLLDKQKIYAERNLQMWISQLFTKKEKYVMKRILNNKPVSRTEYEYYSRKTRKKLNSIMGLQNFAQTLQAKTPKYDSRLFKLKKLLEQWCSKELKTILTIEDYHIFKENIIVHAKEKDGSFHDASFKLIQIKEEELLGLLQKYSEHDFT